MSIIYHKVWRDLWRNKTRTILAMLSTAVGIQLAVGLLAPMFAALWPVLAGARTTVRQAIASYGLGANFGAGLIDRLIARVRGLPRPLAFSLRNTFRHKGRAALTQITLIIREALAYE